MTGIDASREMVEQARARNKAGIRSGRVDLRHASVESLPFADDRQIGCALRPGGRIALGLATLSPGRRSRPPERLLSLHLGSASADSDVGEHSVVET